MNNRIVILGGGESGTGAAILAKANGFDVFVSDSGEMKEQYKVMLEANDVEWEENKHTESLILDASEVIKSPGIPDKTSIIQMIKSHGIPIVSEIEFAGRYTNAKKICITGSNGKTTTTMLIYHLLKKAGLNVGLAGNVGQSFALQIVEHDYDYYVIELSSFQLDGMYDFKADIAVLMNITPDHLDRYDYKFQNYINSKFKITQNLTKKDAFIYCSDDDVVINELEKHDVPARKFPFSLNKSVNQGAYLLDETVNFNVLDNNFSMSIQELSLHGKHNVYNSMAAGITGSVLNIRKEIIRESLSDFQSVEHRLEPVIKVHGIEFINDSKATNVNSTWYALESMKTKVIWIAGGVDKGNDYSMLTDIVKEKVEAIICLGKDNEKLHKAFAEYVPSMVDTMSINEAVKAAYHFGKKGYTVLLSPACASFDLFENYEDRGRQFKKAVRDL